MPLTNTAIRQAKSKLKQYKLYDERDLFLLISPKRWVNGGVSSIGLTTRKRHSPWAPAPYVSLKDAWDRRDEARKQVAAGIDPGEHRKARQSAKAVRQANCFEVIAREW